jgi:hypothetical protein
LKTNQVEWGAGSLGRAEELKRGPCEELEADPYMHFWVLLMGGKGL